MCFISFLTVSRYRGYFGGCNKALNKSWESFFFSHAGRIQNLFSCVISSRARGDGLNTVRSLTQRGLLFVLITRQYPFLPPQFILILQIFLLLPTVCFSLTRSTLQRGLIHCFLSDVITSVGIVFFPPRAAGYECTATQRRDDMRACCASERVAGDACVIV